MILSDFSGSCPELEIMTVLFYTVVALDIVYFLSWFYLLLNNPICWRVSLCLL